ncbi:MAG: type II toxin-antitoxin system VapC family toxin [Betaproteobacteria bacterium]|nr:type II toxin-antitoxin system VapC family toxin [Betaproteobacteria bacterium]
MTPDVNVLVAASRGDHPHHVTARNWLDKALRACEGGASLKLMPMVSASFLRLVTHVRIFPRPTPTADALAFLDALMVSPGVETPSLGREWPKLRELYKERALAANDIPDAWLAAAVMHYSEHLVTFDKGFKRWLAASQVTVLAP